LYFTLRARLLELSLEVTVLDGRRFEGSFGLALELILAGRGLRR
jgi:hypothetical protein